MPVAFGLASQRALRTREYHQRHLKPPPPSLPPPTNPNTGLLEPPLQQQQHDDDANNVKSGRAPQQMSSGAGVLPSGTCKATICPGLLAFEGC